MCARALRVSGIKSFIEHKSHALPPHSLPSAAALSSGHIHRSRVTKPVSADRTD